MSAAAPGPTAHFDLLLEGGLSPLVWSSCSLIRDGEHVVVVDPGMSPSQAAILEPLAALGLAPGDVTDVVLSHHHPDHALNVGLFPGARVHDHWAIYDFSGRWDHVDGEGRVVSPAVTLIRTPGHTAEDISTLIRTGDGLVVCTHLWWTDTVPVEDPVATDTAALHASRARVLGLPGLTRIVPGHGSPFVPSAGTPR
jgi:glyoxylase-like metal-dependent hydrolase (beta-lactamase superfamily II)